MSPAKHQVMVVGLGQFGMALCEALGRRGVEVLAVDRDPDRVSLAAERVSEALVFDATDERALGDTAPARRDACVCAIGDEAAEASIICTALLKQMGASRLIARAKDPLHERILRLVGADVVINPEREFGNRFANIMLHEQVLGELPLGEDLMVTELEPPPAFVGRTLKELELPRRHAVTVVAIRAREGEAPRSAGVVAPRPDVPIREDDLLVLVSASGAVTRMLDRLAL